MAAASRKPPARVSGTRATVATSSAWTLSMAVISGTVRMRCAKRAHITLERLPNMGAAVISASSQGWAWKILSAITPTKPPSMRANPGGSARLAVRSRR